MMTIFNLIQWRNLLLIALTQFLIKYALLETLKNTHSISLTLSSWHFFILVMATLCITAAGFIIIAIEDNEAIKINTPEKHIIGKHISEKFAFNLYLFFNVIGVFLGFILSYAIDSPNYAVFFVMASAVLYIYSSYLKYIVLIRNLVLALLSAFTVLIVGVLDVIPVLNFNNRDVQLFFFKLILDYAIFVFMLSLLRDIIMDIISIQGHYKLGIKSLPILIGQKRTSYLLTILTLIITSIIIWYVINNLNQQIFALIIILLVIVAPLIYEAIKLFDTEKKEDFKRLHSLINIVMIMGISTLLLFQFIA